MLFDPTSFAASVNKYTTTGDPTALEAYLLGEIKRLEDGRVMTCSGASCPCGKSEETMQREDDAFRHNLYSGLISCASELASLYRGLSLWDKCLSTYKEIGGYLEQAGLLGTFAQVRVQVNEAYARIDANDLEGASKVLDAAESIAERTDNDKDVLEVVSRLHDARAVVLARQGDEEGASAAAKKSVDAMGKIGLGSSEFISMVLNHAATLAQLGSPKEALDSVEGLLVDGTPDALRGDLLYQALNLRAMIFSRMGNFVAAADAFADLIDQARQNGALEDQLPMLCINCGQMYQRAGNQELASKYSSLAAALSSDGR